MDYYSRKSDKGKQLAGVLFEDFIDAMSSIVDVATFGANKYKRSSWKTVPDAELRYTDALFRHMISYFKDKNSRDQESGYEHIEHAAWNILALLQLKKDRDRTRGYNPAREPSQMSLDLE